MPGNLKNGKKNGYSEKIRYNCAEVNLEPHKTCNPMKTISATMLAVMALALSACNDGNADRLESQRSAGIRIVDGWIQEPEWLANEIDRILEGNLPPSSSGVTRETIPFSVWVSVVKHDGRNYILVENIFDSCFACGHRFFTTSGGLVENQDLYKDLLGEKDRTHIWPPQD